MAKNVLEKTLRNQPLNREPRGDRRQRESWVFKVEVDPSDKGLLRNFCKHELNFYNGLVQGLSTRLRAFPDVLLNFTGPWEALFADSAAIGANVSRIATPEQLPEAL